MNRDSHAARRPGACRRRSPWIPAPAGRRGSATRCPARRSGSDAQRLSPEAGRIDGADFPRTAGTANAIVEVEVAGCRRTHHAFCRSPALHRPVLLPDDERHQRVVDDRAVQRRLPRSVVEGSAMSRSSGQCRRFRLGRRSSEHQYWRSPSLQQGPLVRVSVFGASSRTPCSLWSCLRVDCSKAIGQGHIAWRRPSASMPSK